MKEQTLADVLDQIRKRKEAISASLGKEYGMVIPSLGLEAINNLVGPPSDDVNGSPVYMEEHLERWQEIATFYCKAYIEKQAGGNGHHAVRGKKGPYQKPFERRLRLVEFVTTRWARIKNNRFSGEDWIQITSEWNKSFPIEQIKPGVLRVEYSRAIHENDLMSHLLAMHSLKDGQIGKKPWDKEELKQFFQILGTGDSSKKGEPVLSLLYKHYVLGGLSKQIPMNKKRIKTALKLAEEYRKIEKQKRGTQ